MFHQVFAEKLTFGVTFGVLSSAVLLLELAEMADK
jgi:hypothetical protein